MCGRVEYGLRVLGVLAVVLLTALALSSVPGAHAEEHEERWVSEDARHLLREAHELREEGKVDQAEELEERAESIERKARARREREEKREREVEWVSDDAHHLFRQAQELREEGKLGQAEELEQRAENIEREARAHRKREAGHREQAERDVPRFTSDEAHALYAKGLALQREGRGDAAHELFEKAERSEAQARERAERREHAERDERPADTAKLHAEITELRQDVKRLQAQVEELTVLVRRLVRE